MKLPDFDYATLQFINTWDYSVEPFKGNNGCMGIARLHSKAAPDVSVALFTKGARHQNTFENLFATKAKFNFSVEVETNSQDEEKMNALQKYEERGADRCDPESAGAFEVRAVWYPVCP